MEKKRFKYYAIRIYNSVVFRRTIGRVTRVRSKIYKTNGTFVLEQISYTGGSIVATMSYNDWIKYHGTGLNHNRCVEISRVVYRGLSPYMLKGDV